MARPRMDRHVPSRVSRVEAVTDVVRVHYTNSQGEACGSQLMERSELVRRATEQRLPGSPKSMFLGWEDREVTVASTVTSVNPDGPGFMDIPPSDSVVVQTHPSHAVTPPAPPPDSGICTDA